MIRIGKHRETKRLHLGGDAFLTYRTATTVDREAGAIAARRFLDSVRSGAAALANYGVDIGGAGELDRDPALSFGVSSVVSITEIGMRCISGWDGVADAAGNAEFNRRNLAELLNDPFYYELVSEALLARLTEIDQEGNAFAPSPNGEQAGAPITADPAAT